MNWMEFYNIVINIIFINIIFPNLIKSLDLWVIALVEKYYRQKNMFSKHYEDIVSQI